MAVAELVYSCTFVRLARSRPLDLPTGPPVPLCVPPSDAAPSGREFLTEHLRCKDPESFYKKIKVSHRSDTEGV